MITLQHMAGPVLALAVSGAPLAVAAPATAAPAAVVAGAPCVTDSAASVPRGRIVPPWRQQADIGAVSQQDLDALPRRETRPDVVARTVEMVHR